MGLADVLTARVDAIIRARLDTAISSRLASDDSRLNNLSNLSNLNAQITSRASATTWTDARAAKLDNLGSMNAIGGTVIKSIQRGTVTVNASSVDVTITAVDINKSFMSVSCVSGHATMTNQFSLTASGRIIGGTTLRFERINTNPTVNPVVAWEVVEFK